MSDVTLATLNRRTAVAAVRQEAARIGADAESILDRQSFYSQLGGLDPDEPGFTARIREMVGAAAGQVPAAGQARQPAAPARPGGERDGSAAGNRQWTLDDVKRSTPAECAAALEAGLLLDLGAAPTRRR